MKPTQKILMALVVLLAPSLAPAAPAIKAMATPAFGQEVRLEVQDDGYPAYLPGTRWSRNGSVFDVDVEFLRDAFGPFPPGVGTAVVSLGELLPGNYEVRTRALDAVGNTPPRYASANLRVAPPAQPGLYTVPREPRALSPIQVLLNSALYVDKAKMRVSMGTNLIRVDFEFLSHAPAHGAAPDGYAPYVAAPLPPLMPGSYRMEAWGTPQGGSGAQLYFTAELKVKRSTTVVEFYNEKLDHYFITARGEDIEALDSGAYGGWKRTGLSFDAWARASDALPGARAVCRFYAPLHNSHFFTADPNECEKLKSDEKSGRADAMSRKQSFTGWQFEDIAFYTLAPTEGSCPTGTARVMRAYNGRGNYNDANHRFTADAAQALAMMGGWIDEGVAFCSPL